MKILASPGYTARQSNPYTWLLYSNIDADVVEYSVATALKGRFDIFHVHWPEGDLNFRRTAAECFARLCISMKVIDTLRARGTKIFWTVHNLAAHDSRYPRMERWFWKQFTKRVDACIALSANGASAAMERFPALSRVPCFVVPHGHYRGEYPTDPSCDARQALGISKSARVLLFFGRIRPYKNLPTLLDAFRRMAISPDTELLIAGQDSPDLRSALNDEAHRNPRVRFDLGMIPSGRVHLYFRAADLVVLPYRDILNSGTALLALSFNRPVLVPDRGAMAELAETVGDEWVRRYSGEINAGKLEAAIYWATKAQRLPEAPLDHLSWPQISRQTLAAYQEVVGANHVMGKPTGSAV